MFFDLDHTLIDRSSALGDYLARLGRRHEVFASQEEQNHLSELDDSGYRPRDEFCAALARQYPQIWATPAEAWRDFCHGLDQAIPERPEVTAMVARLARRYTLAVVSNGGTIRQQRKLRRAGLVGFFEVVVLSEQAGAAKPDHTIFTRALAATRLGPHEVLFVGDDPVCDIAGARAAGLGTCWVSHGRPYPSGGPQPDLSVNVVTELGPLLEPQP